MKIEICEQMMQTWLLHCKQCQIVQTNWSISPLRDIPSKDINDAYDFVKATQNRLNETLETEIISALQESVDQDNIDSVLAEENINKKRKSKKLNIIKKSTASQFIHQCEIDVVGVKLFEGIVDRVFLVDSAFHKNGLGYHDVTATVIKKIIRAALVGNIIFGKNVDVTIVFVSPKCGNKNKKDIESAVDVIRKELASTYPKVTIELYFNEDFTTSIYQPLVKETQNLNNDNDLFMRSLNLIKVSEANINTPITTTSPAGTHKSTSKISKTTPIIISNPSDLNDFKVELINKKRAEITWEYSDGKKYVEFWNATNVTLSSNIKANIKGQIMANYHV